MRPPRHRGSKPRELKGPMKAEAGTEMGATKKGTAQRDPPQKSATQKVATQKGTARGRDSESANAAPDPSGRRWILGALMMAMMLAAMDTTIVSTAIPQIVGDLGGFALFSWVFSIYLLAQTVTIPVYGKLADTFGRKPVLVI